MGAALLTLEKPHTAIVTVIHMTPVGESMSSEASQYNYVKWHNIPLMITHLTGRHLYLKLKTFVFFWNTFINLLQKTLVHPLGSYGLTSQRQQSGTHSWHMDSQRVIIFLNIFLKVISWIAWGGLNNGRIFMFGWTIWETTVNICSIKTITVKTITHIIFSLYIQQNTKVLTLVNDMLCVFLL